MIGQTLEIIGISKKGKERIKQHGPKWIVIKEDDEEILLQSITNQYMRWMKKQNDPHFKINNSR